jgi:hypothetical protein
VVATYGRGFWIMDDITPLQQLTEEVLDASAHLFEPRPAYRFLGKSGRVGQPEDPAAGQNPRGGASIHYFLDEGVQGPVRMNILDASGEVVSSVGGVSRSPGLHRVNWNLRYPSSGSPRMRTKVLEHSHVPLGEDGWRPAGDGGRVSPLAPPGEYTVRLTVGDQEFTQPLTVLKDPNSAGTEAEIQEQFRVILQIRDDADATVDLINEAEVIRAQLVDLKELIRGKDGAEQIVAAADALNVSLIDLEMGLTDLRLSGGQDTLRWPRQLLAKLTSLAGYISGTDFVPTTQQMEVLGRLQGLLSGAQARMAAIKGTELAALNQLLLEMGIGHVIAGGG